MGSLNRQKCGELLDEFKSYVKSETDMGELTSDAERVIRTFCEAVATDDVVGEKFDALMESGEEKNNSTQTDSRGGGRGRNGYSGEERRKKEGGWHMFERRKKAFKYPDSAKNDKRVQFGRAK